MMTPLLSSLVCLLVSPVVMAAPFTTNSNNAVAETTPQATPQAQATPLATAQTTAIQSVPSAADVLTNIKFTCKESGVTHQVGDQWVNGMNFKMECLPSGLIQVSGCKVDGHDFPLSPQPTQIGQYQYWCCVNSKGSYNFQRIDTSNNNLGVGSIVQDPDGTLRFVPQPPQFCT